MTTNRLEAFSDGIFAIVLVINALLAVYCAVAGIRSSLAARSD